jgi:hypothetical protein
MHIFKYLSTFSVLFPAAWARPNPQSSDLEALTAQAIDHGTCTTIYKPKKGSCNYWGFWDLQQSDGELKRTGCINQGCKISSGLDNDVFCSGDPSCKNPDFRGTQFCEQQRQCSCDSGWKMYQGKCAEIICEGKWVQGELTSEDIHGGKRWFDCKGRNDV